MEISAIVQRSLAGKRVWITGASSGIGEASALYAAQAGASLVLSARREDELERVNQAAGGGHAVVPLDLGDLDSLSAVTGAVCSEGVPDIVVHNGGVSQRALARDTDLATVQRILTINTLGAIGITHALLPAMRARGSGRFVVISSMVGKFGTPYRSTYAASKHALHGYFDSLRAEEYEAGLGVTMVCPGFVQTNVSLNAFSGDGSAHGEIDPAQKTAMSANEFAERMWAGVAREANELIIAGAKEQLAWVMKRVAPDVLNRMLRSMAVT